jgi:metal-dependent amidase/aminoacylase/carboxypeptidase family protein
LQLTVRSYSDDVRTHLLDAIRRKAKAAAISADAPEPTVEVSESTPALINNGKLVERISPVFRRVFGDDQVEAIEPMMGSEDFSRYGRAGVPIFMFQLGAVDTKRLADFARFGQLPPSLHSPLFYPDAEPTLTTGVTAMASAALELLKKGE